MRKRLVTMRKDHGYTQQTFSKAVECSLSHYAQIETGDKWPSLRLAMRIKDALDYYDDDLFENIPRRAVRKKTG